MQTTFLTVILALYLLAGPARAADESPLAAAIAGGNIAAVDALLAAGADPVEDSCRLLWLAIENQERYDIAKLLLSRGADVNSRCTEGKTALHLAVSLGSINAVRFLIANGADVNARDPGGETPLHETVHAMESGADIAGRLISAGADVTVRSESSGTPLSSAIFTQKWPIIELLEDYFVRSYILHPFDPDSPTRATISSLQRSLSVYPEDIVNLRIYRLVLIDIANRLDPPLAIPEAARKSFVEGSTIVKMATSKDQLAMAAKSFCEAANLAPWWGDAYYNHGVVEELRGEYFTAEKAFELYLRTNPGEAERREAQDRIYALAVKRKLAEGR